MATKPSNQGDARSILASSPNGDERPAARTASPKAALGDESAAPSLSLSFDEALETVRTIRSVRGSRLLRPVMMAAAPLLGALDDRTKRALAEATGGSHVFSAEAATALNVVLNFLLYPVLGYLAGLSVGIPVFGESDRGWILLGVVVATVETLVRLREGIFRAEPVGHFRLGGSAYGAPVGWMLRPLIGRVVRWRRSGVVPVGSFVGGGFESKRERERRYGEVYTVEEHDRGAYVRLELPRRIPPSKARDRLAFGQEMPDYDVRVDLTDGVLTVRGTIADSRLRALCSISPAFPADFRTRIPLRGPFDGWIHRYRNKLLEIVVVRTGVLEDGDGSNQSPSG